MKKVIVLLLALVMIFGVVACQKTEEPDVTATKAPEVKEETKTEEKEENESMEDIDTSQAGDVLTGDIADVEVYVTFNGEKFITYNESTPWDGPNGEVIKKGDFLPTWEHIRGAININLIDKTPKSGAKEGELLEQAAADGFADANVFMGPPKSISAYGVQGYFVALDMYPELVPNFTAFLEANPAVKGTLTQTDGHIYLAPYFDGINDLERMFQMRLDWVMKILDEDGDYDTQKTIDTMYEAAYDYAGGKTVSIGVDNAQTFDIAENIIAIQNALAVKDGATLTQALKDYIDANYMNDKTGYTKRSDLFISSEAAYDADELIALMRAVKANPVYLTGEDKDLIMFFARRVKDTENMKYFSAIWGVLGADSENSYLYFAENGDLKDARYSEDYLDALENMNLLYQEGLILEDFDQEKGQISDFRNLSFQTNDGFITYDYAASTVAQHNLIAAEDLAAYGTIFEPVVPPAAQWFDDDFYHYAEGNRSVKTAGGWGVAKHTDGDEAELAAALRLIDYPFSNEGLEVMTFGPEGFFWNERIEINGREVPKLLDIFTEQAEAYAGGNWSNFLRGFVGSTMGVGHVKDTIMIETQVSNEHYGNGIGRIKASATVLSSLTPVDDPRMKVVPTIIPLTEDQNEALSVNTFTDYYKEWFIRVIKYGFGAPIPNSSEVVVTREAYLAEMNAKGMEQELKILNIAYAATQE